MPQLTIAPVRIYGWEGIRLSEGDLSLCLAPQIGGRIISFKYKSHELFFVQDKHAGEVHDLKGDLSLHKKSLGFRLWGGDKTWIAPQKDWLQGIPPLELDAGQYEIHWENTTAVMTSPVCRETALQIVRRIKLEDGRVFLREELYNRGSKPVEKGIWNVTQVLRPCKFYVPAQEGAIYSYHHEDKTLPPVGENFAKHRDGYEVSCEDAQLFKYGCIPLEGKVTIQHTASNLAWAKTFAFSPDAVYPHNSAVEIFNSCDYPYAEVEIHSPTAVIPPGKSIALEQIWSLK